MALTTSYQKIGESTYTVTGSNKLRLYAKYNSQSVADNKSNVTLQLRTIATSGYYTSSGNSSTLTCRSTNRGTQYYDIGTVGTSSEKTIGTWTFDLYHLSDGTLTGISASASANVYGSLNPSVSGSFDLPSIPRQATILTAPDFYTNVNPTITYQNLAGNSVSELIAYITDDNGNYQYSWARNLSKTGSSYTFSLSSSEINDIRNHSNNNQTPIRFYVRTLIGSTYYYSYLSRIAYASYEKATLLTGQDFTDEGNPTITYTNAEGNNVTSLQACIASTNGQVIYAPYRDVNKTGTLSYTFNLTSSERTALRQACTGNSMNIEFALRTVIGGNTYYSVLYKTMTIVNGNPTFSNITSVADTNSTTIALTGDSSKCIKGYSNALVTISSTDKATANKEATMSSYIVNGITKTYAENFTYTVNGISTNAVTVQASDSRGNSTTVSKSIDLINYFAPTNTNNNLVVQRQNNIGSIVSATFSGTWWNDNFGNSTNALSVSYRFKTTDSSIWTTGTAPTLTINNNSFSFSGNLIGDQADNGFDVNEAYNIEITVSDSLSTTTFSTILNSGKPAIAVNKNKVSIGSAYSSSLGGKLQVDGYLVCCYEVVQNI